MKNLAKWLSEHAWVLGGGGKDSVLHLWCILFTVVIMSVFGAFGWVGKEFEVLMAVMCLGGTFIPPVAAGVIALVKRQKWNPWYWFPIVIGIAVGGFTAVVIGLLSGWCQLF